MSYQVFQTNLETLRLLTTFSRNTEYQIDYPDVYHKISLTKLPTKRFKIVSYYKKTGQQLSSPRFFSKWEYVLHWLETHTKAHQAF